MSKDIKIEEYPTTKQQSIAVIGAGPAGLSAAWLLKKNGYRVTVFEKDKEIGGKPRQVMPYERLSKESLWAVIERVKKTGINFNLNTELTQEIFNNIKNQYDALIIACGAHNPIIIPFEGHEKLIKGLEFLKSVKSGQKPRIGKKVVVIGAGNVAMDVVIEAYKCGAQKVCAIDIQKPAAFPKEILRCKEFGAEIMYPCFTEKVTDKGVQLKDGNFLEADSVIISIGDRPVFDFLPQKWLDERGMLKLDIYSKINGEKVFACGDAIKQGLFTNAIADGNKAAKNVMCLLENKPLGDFATAPMLPRDKVKTEYYKGIAQIKIQQIEPWD